MVVINGCQPALMTWKWGFEGCWLYRTLFEKLNTANGSGQKALVMFFNLQSILQTLLPRGFLTIYWESVEASTKLFLRRSKEDTSGWVENSIPGAHSSVWRAAVSTPLLQLPTTRENCLCCWNDSGIWVSRLGRCLDANLECQKCFLNVRF